MNTPLAVRDFAPEFQASFSADEFIKMISLARLLDRVSSC